MFKFFLSFISSSSSYYYMILTLLQHNSVGTFGCVKLTDWIWYFSYEIKKILHRIDLWTPFNFGKLIDDHNKRQLTFFCVHGKRCHDIIAYSIFVHQNHSFYTFIHFWWEKLNFWNNDDKHFLEFQFYIQFFAFFIYYILFYIKKNFFFVLVSVHDF